MEELKLKTSDNITIAVNHYSKGFDKVVIIAPGWFMTKDSKFFQQMSEIFSESIDVLALDFRGHGKSGGRRRGEIHPGQKDSAGDPNTSGL